MRPASPAGFGYIPDAVSGDRAVFLLPGNPVSCLCAYEFFAGPTIRALGGRSRRWPHPRQRVRAASKLVSVLGRTIGGPDTSTRRLPAAAFQFIAPADPRGNLGRNTFRKGPIGNLNASLSRTWKIRSEKSLTLRAESINFLNTAQFAEPTKTLTSPSFGQITNTLNDGRTFRFLLRFAF